MKSNIEKVVSRKDFQGSYLVTGTRVVFMEVGYRNFVTGIITSMGNKKGTIKQDNGKLSVQFYYQMIRANQG